MNARIAADESSLVPHQPVRVARSGRKLDRHQMLTGLAVVLEQGWFPLGIRRAVVSGHDPDIAFVVEIDVVQAGPLLRAYANQDLWNPCLRVHTQEAAETQRGNPELALVPLHAVSTATFAIDAQRNLAMGDLFAVHVDLEDAVRFGVRAHPHAAVAIRHAG